MLWNYTCEVTHDATPTRAEGGTASILQMRKLRFREVKNITKQVRDTAQNWIGSNCKVTSTPIEADLYLDTQTQDASMFLGHALSPE